MLTSQNQCLFILLPFEFYREISFLTAITKRFVNLICILKISGSPARYHRRRGGAHLEEQQLTPQILGQPDQEPGLRLRHRQEQHCRLLPLSHRSDLHGRLLHVGAHLGQGLSQLQAPLRQRHSRVQRLGGPVLRGHQGHASHLRSGFYSHFLTNITFLFRLR